MYRECSFICIECNFNLNYLNVNQRILGQHEYLIIKYILSSRSIISSKKRNTSEFEGLIKILFYLNPITGDDIVKTSKRKLDILSNT